MGRTAPVSCIGQSKPDHQNDLWPYSVSTRPLHLASVAFHWHFSVNSQEASSVRNPAEKNNNSAAQAPQQRSPAVL